MADKNESLQSTEPKALIIQRVINWVAFDNKKPVLGKAVLILLKSGYMTVGYRTKDASGFLWQLFGDIGCHFENEEITYWAELPKPPCL
tara:strand:+ start:300 stop:566 length:267 start_codon:yes stop_codon:yes gene_type:complete